MDIRGRHNLYLSNTVWAELRRRAVIEGDEASEIVESVLHAWLETGMESDLPERRSRIETLENLGKRTVYVRKNIWDEVGALAKERRFSISVLVEHLLRNYLGLAPSADILPRN